MSNAVESASELSSALVPGFCACGSLAVVGERSASSSAPDDKCASARIWLYRFAPPMQNTFWGVTVELGSGSEDERRESIRGSDEDIRIADLAGVDDGVRSTVVEAAAFASGVSLLFGSPGLDGVAAVERRRSWASQDSDSEEVWSSSRMRLPSSFTFPRVVTTLSRPASGRNLEGMLSHVFLPMINAFKAPAVLVSGTLVVSFLKNAMSPLMPDHGSVPWLPMPMEGFSAVATIT